MRATHDTPALNAPVAARPRCRCDPASPLTMRPHDTPTIRSAEIAAREIRNLASIRRRVDGGHLTGRNDAATWATVEYKVRALQAFFAAVDETPETERLYDRFNALERWSVGLD